MARLDRDVASATVASSLLEWIRSVVTGWKPSIVGVFREDAEHGWPITAESASQLRETLTKSGHLLPLPTEPAALANVMEIELRRHLCEAAGSLDGASIVEGTERSFPDLELSGEAFGGGTHAVDIKCARIKPAKTKRADDPEQPDRLVHRQYLLLVATAQVLRNPASIRRTTRNSSLSLFSTGSTPPCRSASRTFR